MIDKFNEEMAEGFENTGGIDLAILYELKQQNQILYKIIEQQAELIEILKNK